MRYLALASDYDGTLAAHGCVNKETVAALERLQKSGRKFILVTGRELDELLQIFKQIHLCDLVVAENGALLYEPATGEEKLLGTKPPEEFVKKLSGAVAPLSVGRAIVATWRPNETKVFEVIRELGLELQVIFNKDAVMILPRGVNKAFGLKAALDKLGLSPNNVVGIGDAENDRDFLSACGCGVAVANALDLLKEQADFVTQGARGAGVIEIIDYLVANDLSQLKL